MAENFSFFDPVEVAPGVWDREYFAQQFTDYFRRLVTTGVMKGESGELKVSTEGNSMITTLSTGVAYVVGRSYENTSPLPHTHDTEVLGKNRIDRIVVRLDLRTESRFVKSFIKKGVASTNPVPPDLQRDQFIYEISLAQVKIVGGQTYINANDVIDERGKTDICPWAGSKILPNFDNATLENHIHNYTEHIPYANATTRELISTTVYDINLDGITEYYEGLGVSIKTDATNTKYAFLNINGIGDIRIVDPYGSLPSIGSFKANNVYTLRYNGSYFVVQGYVPSNDSGNLVIKPFNGWEVDYSGELFVRKIGTVVYVFGNLKKKQSATLILCQLPAGYRPDYSLLISARVAINGTYQRVDGFVNESDGSILLDVDTAKVTNDSYATFNFSFIQV